MLVNIFTFCPTPLAPIINPVNGVNTSVGTKTNPEPSVVSDTVYFGKVAQSILRKDLTFHRGGIIELSPNYYTTEQQLTGFGRYFVVEKPKLTFWPLYDKIDNDNKISLSAKP